MKEREYKERLREKFEVMRGLDGENMQKECEKFRDIVMLCTNDVWAGR